MTCLIISVHLINHHEKTITLKSRRDIVKIIYSELYHLEYLINYQGFNIKVSGISSKNSNISSLNKPQIKHY